jgi:hypothetical protein
LNESDPTHPANIARLKATKAEEASPVVELRQPAEPQNWTRVIAQVSPPDERSTGIVCEGKFAIIDGEIHVRDLRDKHLGTAPYNPANDAKAIARRLLREKTADKWGFYAPINYPHEVNSLTKCEFTWLPKVHMPSGGRP